ncbi:hypothetical protein, unlikely [Trypanosoma congolense IL3000]|uniref:Uncharacterized protein n=1 Tax=Trypanosoma congolense (strain IL3000) TaxID=1068625 RepID=F9W8B7_TRYCI|nr:hypothetical protein, unlikely [Trypanosoma congolense IL3000]
MREKRPGHDESLRPQPRAKPKRKTTRSEAQAQDEGKWVDGVGRCVGMRKGHGSVREWVATRKVRRDEIMCVEDAIARISSGTRLYGTQPRLTTTLRQGNGR